MFVYSEELLYTLMKTVVSFERGTPADKYLCNNGCNFIQCDSLEIQMSHVFFCRRRISSNINLDKVISVDSKSKKFPDAWLASTN